jgi:hypothetical protein
MVLLALKKTRAERITLNPTPIQRYGKLVPTIIQIFDSPDIYRLRESNHFRTVDLPRSEIEFRNSWGGGVASWEMRMMHAAELPIITHKMPWRSATDQLLTIRGHVTGLYSVIRQEQEDMRAALRERIDRIVASIDIVCTIIKLVNAKNIFEAQKIRDQVIQYDRPLRGHEKKEWAEKLRALLFDPRLGIDP